MKVALNVVLCISAQSSATLVEALRDLIDSSELGALLNDLPCEGFPTLQYLTDFVHMVYKSSSEDEHKVLLLSFFTMSKYYIVTFRNSQIRGINER